MSKPPSPPRKPLSPGQRLYEERRAGKAGVRLEQWIDLKEREKRAAARPKKIVLRKPGRLRMVAAWVRAQVLGRLGRRQD